MNNPIITILGSCRQDSLYKKYNITNIKNNLSYPHYTKEVLQVIKYCVFNNLTPEQTMIFRTPILNNLPIKNNPFLNKIEESNVIIIEISSKKYYKYKELYAHHILYDDNKYNKNKNEIETGTLTDKEIVDDLHEIVKLLRGKRIIFVGHLVTKKEGERYNLLVLIKDFCLKNNILFIDPIKELLENELHIDEIIEDPNTHFAHYTQKGHNAILKIYENFIENM